DYIARSTTENGTMPKHPVVVKSLVSTTMADAVAAEYGIEIRSVLTGFKYIGEQIALLEQAGEAERFLLGFEESYGYLSGGYVRDKDAVDGSMLVCEMAAWYKRRGKNLGQALDEMYEKYGYYLNKVDSYTFEGSDGMARMSGILDQLRAAPPTALAGIPVSHSVDYRTGVRTENGAVTRVELPSSNVLEYGLLATGSCIVRPSGTEPKLKLYYSIKGESREKAASIQQSIRAAAEQLLGL
ncbi:MAG: phospho-sugar mutase, partial [Angelakisella sp.]